MLLSIIVSDYSLTIIDYEFTDVNFLLVKFMWYTLVKFM